MATEQRKRKISQGGTSKPKKKHRHLTPLPALEAEELKNKIYASTSTTSFSPFSYEEFFQIYSSFNGNELLIMSENLDGILWKSHHARITTFRQRMTTIERSQKNNTKVRKKTVTSDVAPFLEFVTKGSEFYKHLISEIRIQHGLSGCISDGWNCDKKKQVQRICYDLLMHLGDLARYRVIYCTSQKTRHFEVPKMLYQQAFNIRHCNGTAHNQLGVIALNTKNYVAAIYHYLRSMFVKHPSSSSHDNLTTSMQKLSDDFTNLEKVDNLTFSDAFCELAHILLMKLERLAEVGLLLDKSLETLHKLMTTTSNQVKKQKTKTGIYVVTILIASVEDFYSGTMSNKTKLPMSYLLHSVNAAVKFAYLYVSLTLEDPERTMLPILGIFFAWLANQTHSQEIIRATMAEEAYRQTFLELLREAETLLQSLPLPSEELLIDSDDTLKTIPGLWEDEELRGFTPLNLGNDEVVDTGYSEEQLNWIRGHRLDLSLRIISKYAGFDVDSPGSSPVEVPVHTCDPMLEEVNPTVQNFLSPSDSTKDEGMLSTGASLGLMSSFRQESQTQDCRVVYTAEVVDLEEDDEAAKLVIPNGAISQMKAHMKSFKHLYQTRNPFVVFQEEAMP